MTVQGMETSVCSCDDYDVEPCKYFQARFIKARKEHRCNDCDATIKPGEMYEKITGYSDNEWFTHKQCRVCRQIQRDYGCYIGELREQVQELLGVDYVTGETFDDDDEEGSG